MRKVLVLVLSIICLVSGVICITDILQKQQEEKQYDVLRESVTIETTIAATEVETIESVDETEPVVNTYEAPEGLSNLMDTNTSVIGWLKIDGTNVDYPVVQKIDDNEYFLHRDINGNESKSGSIYLDSNHDVNEPGLHVIYGHHMKNGTMFKDVAKFISDDYMKEHSNITIWTDEKEICLKPVYCYAGPADGAYRGVISSKEELEAFLYEKTGQEIEGENIFVFITCSYGGADERTYLILQEVTE